jgi:hypothetical protein
VHEKVAGLGQSGPFCGIGRPGDADAARRVRFCFPKRDETLLEAGRRLQRLYA